MPKRLSFAAGDHPDLRQLSPDVEDEDAALERALDMTYSAFEPVEEDSAPAAGAGGAAAASGRLSVASAAPPDGVEGEDEAVLTVTVTGLELLSNVTFPPAQPLVVLAVDMLGGARAQTEPSARTVGATPLSHEFAFGLAEGTRARTALTRLIAEPNEPLDPVLTLSVLSTDAVNIPTALAVVELGARALLEPGAEGRELELALLRGPPQSGEEEADELRAAPPLPDELGASPPRLAAGVSAASATRAPPQPAPPLPGALPSAVRGEHRTDRSGDAVVVGLVRFRVTGLPLLTQIAADLDSAGAEGEAAPAAPAWRRGIQRPLPTIAAALATAAEAAAADGAGPPSRYPAGYDLVKEFPFTFAHAFAECAAVSARKRDIERAARLLEAHTDRAAGRAPVTHQRAVMAAVNGDALRRGRTAWYLEEGVRIAIAVAPAAQPSALGVDADEAALEACALESVPTARATEALAACAGAARARARGGVGEWLAPEDTHAHPVTGELTRTLHTRERACQLLFGTRAALRSVADHQLMLADRVGRVRATASFSLPPHRPPAAPEAEYVELLASGVLQAEAEAEARLPGGAEIVRRFRAASALDDAELGAAAARHGGACALLHSLACSEADAALAEAVLAHVVELADEASLPTVLVASSALELEIALRNGFAPVDPPTRLAAEPSCEVSWSTLERPAGGERGAIAMSRERAAREERAARMTRESFGEDD